jgi:site-specific DNA recombinase
VERKRARLYRRVSTEDQARHGYSLDAQLRELNDFCDRMRWDVVGDYCDDGYSAKSMKRPALQRLLAEAKSGDVVVFYKLDRITRSTGDLDSLMKEFDKRGIMIRSAMEDFDTTTASGRMFIRVVAVIAEWERETISERTSIGFEQKVEGGDWQGGKVPFGYVAVAGEKVSRKGRVLKRLIPDERTAHIVKAIFHRYLHGDDGGRKVGVRAIARWLNEEIGIRGNWGGKFTSNQITRILTNPVYCGDVTYKRNKSRVVNRKPGSHEPLISREDFDAVIALYEARQLEAPRQATGEYPLSGIAECGVCGSFVGALYKKDRGAYFYRCSSYTTGHGCAPAGERSLTSFKGEIAERILMEKIAALFDKKGDDLRVFIEGWRREAKDLGGVDEGEVKRLAGDIDEAKRAIKRWDDAYEAGKIEIDEWRSRIAPHKARVSELEAKMSEYESRVIVEPDWNAVTTQLGSIAPHEWYEGWSKSSPQRRREEIRNLCEALRMKIVLSPGQTIHLAPDLDTKRRPRKSSTETM